jgi:hypothetical protein
MTDNGGDWNDDKELIFKHKEHNVKNKRIKTALSSEKVGEEPFMLTLRADILGFHFHKHSIRVVVGKGPVGMGSVQVQVRLNDAVVSETIIDCLLTASKTKGQGDATVPPDSDATKSDYTWFSVDIHLSSKLVIDATSVMTIYFTVVDSSPKREQNLVRLATVSLL